MSPRILFLGGTRRGLELMQMLKAEGAQIVYAYVLQQDSHEPDNVSDEILDLCKKNGIPAKLSKKVDKSEIRGILDLKPEMAFLCSWRTIIPEELYKNIPLGCLVSHDSLLPKYRAFAPTAWAIINGESEVGVTLFKIGDGPVDSGDIFDQRKIEVGPQETTTDIYPRISQATVDLYRSFLQAHARGQVAFTRQDESQATYTARRTPADGEIRWDNPARDVFNFIRALMPPYPRSWTVFNGERVEIKSVSPGASLPSVPKAAGEIISVLPDGVVVQCGEGQVMIKEIVRESGRAQKANELFNTTGTILGK